jgi:hypothetical protein
VDLPHGGHQFVLLAFVGFQWGAQLSVVGCEGLSASPIAYCYFVAILRILAIFLL